MENQFLFHILKEGVSPFHCVSAVTEELEKEGFVRLDYEKSWNLELGGKYLVEHHGTTLFAFTIGEHYEKGDMVRLAAAHTDYPCFRIKPNPDFVTKGYAQINVEVYGGPILNTWLDRPLGLAGRVVTKGEDPFSPEIHYYRSEKAVLTIPNLAIHMNREVNKGVELNPQVDLMPILDLLSEEEKSTDYFLTFLSEELKVEKEDILDFELNTYCVEEPCYVGIKDSMISSPRLDNQTSVGALTLAIENGCRESGINLIALFDHEEIGNKSKQGAASLMIRDLLRRILMLLGNTEEEVEQAIYGGMLLSVDVAHGLHPNKVGKMDITNQPVLGKGFCIKEACSQSYATDSEAVSILWQICKEGNIPVQRFANRSDVRGGGTLGSVVSTLLPIRTVDMGIPILAMHSARELMGSSDMKSLTDAVTRFFSL